jgi:hypothetical protein
MAATRVLAIGVGVGIVFAVLDGLLNANPLAQRLYSAYRPIARQRVNAPLGLVFDITAGVVMAMLFVALIPVLPGGPTTRGLAFGVMVWFFRVAMGGAAQAVMFNLPASALTYSLFAGLAEMMILGSLYGIFLRPGQ